MRTLVRGSRKLLKLMRETEGALTGYFAFRIYTALNNRPTLPPKIIEIVTPWRSMPDYDILLSHLGWVSLGSSQASNMLSATVRRIEIYVHIETGFLLSISGTRGSNIVPCVLSRQVSILCCVVTPNKVRNLYLRRWRLKFVPGSTFLSHTQRPGRNFDESPATRRSSSISRVV